MSAVIGLRWEMFGGVKERAPSWETLKSDAARANTDSARAENQFLKEHQSVGSPFLYVVREQKMRNNPHVFLSKGLSFQNLNH